MHPTGVCICAHHNFQMLLYILKIIMVTIKFAYAISIAILSCNGFNGNVNTNLLSFAPCSQLANRCCSWIFPYNLWALNAIDPTPWSPSKLAGTPIKATASVLQMHHAAAMVIMSPQGLIGSPYLKFGRICSVVSQISYYYYSVWHICLLNKSYQPTCQGHYVQLMKSWQSHQTYFHYDQIYRLKNGFWVDLVW